MEELTLAAYRSPSEASPSLPSPASSMSADSLNLLVCRPCYPKQYHRAGGRTEPLPSHPEARLGIRSIFALRSQ